MPSRPKREKQQQILDEVIAISKKERTLKSKERKEKLTEEEKDARRERKLGRKRERLEDSSLSSTTEHKRRRDVQNGGDDELRDRDRYHPREKSSRERSHDKFERETRGGSTREDRQYSTTKSSRSRMAY